uniref:Uncharacterized protein n=1 Tax=Trieres chinensis TaxID=1514140 RepID=A0A7S1YWW1_TRICV
MREVLGGELRQAVVVNARFLHHAEEAKSVQRLGFGRREVGQGASFLTAQDSSWPSHDEADAPVLSRVLFDRLGAEDWVTLFHSSESVDIERYQMCARELE